MKNVTNVSYTADLVYMLMIGCELMAVLVLLVMVQSRAAICSIFPISVALWSLVSPEYTVTKISCFAHLVSPIVLLFFIGPQLAFSKYLIPNTESTLYMLAIGTKLSIAICAYECARKCKLGMPLLWEVERIRELALNQTATNSVYSQNAEETEIEVYVPESLFNSENVNSACIETEAHDVFNNGYSESTQNDSISINKLHDVMIDPEIDYATARVEELLDTRSFQKEMGMRTKNTARKNAGHRIGINGGRFEFSL